MAINYTATSKDNLTLEREAQSWVVVINWYHSDNGILNASDYIEELLK